MSVHLIDLTVAFIPLPFFPFTSTKKVFREKKALADSRRHWQREMVAGLNRVTRMALQWPCSPCHPFCPAPENRKQVFQSHKKACILIANRKLFSFSLHELKTISFYLTKHLSLVLSLSPTHPSAKSTFKNYCERQSCYETGENNLWWHSPSNFPILTSWSGECRGGGAGAFQSNVVPSSQAMRDETQILGVLNDTLNSTLTWICYWAIDVTWQHMAQLLGCSGSSNKTNKQKKWGLSLV